MRVFYTKHALKKFVDLAELGVHVTKRRIHSVLHNPLYTDILSDHPNKIAMGMLDKSHILRVVYREENGTIIIITFYPTGKERYL